MLDSHHWKRSWTARLRNGAVSGASLIMARVGVDKVFYAAQALYSYRPPVMTDCLSLLLRTSVILKSTDRWRLILPFLVIDLAPLEKA